MRRPHLLNQIFFVNFPALDCNFLSGTANHWELPLVAILGMDLYLFSQFPTHPQKQNPEDQLTKLVALGLDTREADFWESDVMLNLPGAQLSS